MSKEARLGIFGCALILAFFLTGVSTALGLYTGSGSGRTQTAGVAAHGLSSSVPPNYASLFTEAGDAAKIAPALVAALYLTERHSDSFGPDLESLDAVYSKCTENDSGAAGPMQFIVSSWNGVIPELKSIGITSPDRCRFRDSIIGAAFLLAGKVKFPQVAAVCSVGADGNYIYSDECIGAWGQSYCGLGGGTVESGCSNENCGAPSYRYCEEVVRKFKIVAG